MTSTSLDRLPSDQALPAPSAEVAAAVRRDPDGRYWVCGVEEEGTRWLWLPLP